MISREICDSVLSIGCPYKHPLGGVAQVMNTYSEEVYTHYKCIVNSGGNNKLFKLIRMVIAYFYTFIVLLIDRRIRILHIHTASYNSFRRASYWVNLGKFFHKKIVLHIHGGGFQEYYKTNPSWIQSILIKVDTIIVLSDFWKKIFTEDYQCKNVVVLENIISYPVKLNLPFSSVKHLLFLGLISNEKGIFDLIELLNTYKVFYKDKIHLHIGGLGEVDRLKTFINKNDLSDFITYEGFVSGKDKIELLNRADIFILPSYIEALPISILEAMSYSLPVLATSVGSIPEVVSSGVNGFLFEPGDMKQMKDQLDQLLERSDLLKQMSKNSFKLSEHFLPDYAIVELNNIYNSLI